MLPLFDMLANAQDGHGIEALARQFDLSRQQTQTALQALLPAFSQGLKRSASDPYGLAAFMNALATGQHVKYFEDAARAFSPAGRAEGEDILGQIFGSKELSRAIAAQAAQATGIGEEIYRQMLPGLAAMIMGGLFKQSTGQLFPGQTTPANPLAAVMGEMMRQSAAMAQPSQAAANPFDTPFGKVLEGMFGRMPRPDAPKPQADPFAGNPFARVFEDMMRFGQPREEQEPEPPVNPSGRPRNTYDDLFGQMFETGRQQREDYQRSMEKLFEQFGAGTGKRE